ncbi:MAG: hypothetical protein U1E10_08710 [Bdellovibrionales bacterium]|nr:hypothetical protein [Bdellovibrionales bacterium]
MKLTKQTALKGALLMVLAANVSWEKLEVGSQELASEAVTGTPATPLAAAGDGKVSQTPAELTVVANGAPPAAIKIAAPDAAKTTLPSHEDSAKICGDIYKLKYQQVEKGGEMMTEITAHRPTRAGDSWVSITWRADLINTIVKKSDADNALMATVKAHRTLKKEACPGSEVATREETGKDDEEKTRIADGMKNCTLDRKGTSLKGEAKLDCWLDQLNSIDKRVGKHKSDEAMSKAVLAEMQRIVRGPFKRLLKDALMSDDEDRADHARELVTEAMQAVEDIGAEHDLGRSSRTGRSNNAVSKLIGELSAMKTGAEAHEESEKYASRAKDVKENLRTTRSELNARRAERDALYQQAMRNPLDTYAMQAYYESNQAYLNASATLDFVKGDYDALRMDIGMNLEPNLIRPLRTMQTTGLMTAQDYKEFSQPFADLQKMMRESVNFMNLSNVSSVAATRTSGFSGTIQNSVLGSDFAIPTNLATVRSTGFSGSARATIPGLPSTAPTLSFQAPRSIFSPN